jgi:hypothetical protein
LDHLLELAQWTDSFKEQRLQKIDDTATVTRPLVSKLLEKQPWKRPRSIDDVLAMSFNEMDAIELNVQQTVAQMHQTLTVPELMSAWWQREAFLTSEVRTGVTQIMTRIYGLKWKTCRDHELGIYCLGGNCNRSLGIVPKQPFGANIARVSGVKEARLSNTEFSPDRHLARYNSFT